uniref:GerAB/ArcD/ProY family transporter n=1 Tax=Paenibacillus sp. FSL M7-0896 TaxID=2921610 RepID=UPI00403EDEB4
MSSRQFTMLLTLYYWGSALLTLPSMLIGISGKDAWASILIGLLVQLLIIRLSVALFVQMNVSAYRVYCS